MFQQQKIQTTTCDTNEENNKDAEDFPIDGIIFPKNNNYTNVNYNNSIGEYELYYISETSDADDYATDNDYDNEYQYTFSSLSNHQQRIQIIERFVPCWIFCYQYYKQRRRQQQKQ